MISPTEFFRGALAGRATHLNLNTRELRHAFEALNIRQWGLPTGVFDWRLWRTEMSGGTWQLQGFVPHGAGHCRVAHAPVFLLPDDARVEIEDGAVLLYAAGRTFRYWRGVPIALLQADAWAARPLPRGNRC